jgi:uncharacterized repeat protein (TIGR03806 family)
LNGAGRAIVRVLVLVAAGCGGAAPGSPDGPPSGDTIPYDTLGRYGLFGSPLAAQQPAAGVLPYDVISVLYQDDARKLRFLSLPAGQAITFDATAPWQFPDDTFLVKTFYYDRDARDPAAGRRLLETRLLHRKDGVFTPYVYVWNDDQTDAQRQSAGQTLSISRIDAQGAPVEQAYRVPSTDQCRTCHLQERQVVPLGPRTRQLDRPFDYGAGPENQLAHLAALGLLQPAPPAPDTLSHLEDPAGTGPLEARARSYLDANCGHCHNPGGAAAPSGLFLSWETAQGIALGLCKPPVAAGPASGSLRYDIVPGQPDESIVLYRMRSTDPQIKMPQGPTVTVDAAGTALLAQWISALSPAGCP